MGRGKPHTFTLMLLGANTLLWALTFWRVERLLGHHFSYPLDDTYIHMALAQGIAHGVYGINAHETTSPSSSVLWPFLLAPFMRCRFAFWAPLAVNTIIGLISCVLLGRFVQRWYLRRRLHTSTVVQMALAVLLVAAANLVPLTFLGMEHGMQVLVTIGCCAGLMEAYAGEPMSRVALSFAVLAPAVRYEDLLLTLCVCVVAALQRRRKTALLTLGLSLLPLVALGLFLHAHGLGYLPNSVLLKGGVGNRGPRGLLTRWHLMRSNLRYYAQGYAHLPLLVVGPLLALLCWRVRRDRVRFAVAASVLAMCAVMVVAGPFGSLYRYDVFFRMAALLVLLGALGVSGVPSPRANLAALALTGAAAFGYVLALRDTPAAAREIFLQQWQMGRFVAEFHPGNVAVNDIGCVSYRSGLAVHVVDLYGLASPEALSAVRNTAWMDEVTRRHDVTLVMIYPSWFAPPPARWQKLGELHTVERGIGVILGGNAVAFYAVEAKDASRLRTLMRQFAATLPPGAWMTMQPDAP